MREEKVKIRCSKCGHKFIEKTEDHEWNEISDNQFGYVTATARCPKCGYPYDFPVVRQITGSLNHVLRKLEVLKFHPVYMGMMLNIDHRVVYKEICENCDGKSPAKLQQVIEFIKSKECKKIEDLFLKIAEFTGPLIKGNNKPHEMKIYLKTIGRCYLKKHLKKNGIDYEYNKEQQEYRFDIIHENYIFHCVVYNLNDYRVRKKYRLILPYLNFYQSVKYTYRYEIEKYEYLYEAFKKEQENKSK